MISKILTSLVLSFLIYGVGFSQPSKMVLIEEGTGTWCAWCPEGKVFSKELLYDYDKELIFIEVHSYDDMTNDEHKESSSFAFYPSGHINRKIKHVQPRHWENALVAELNQTPPVSIDVEVDYDSMSREMTVNVTAEIYEELSGDYRFAAIIVEDGVTGDTESYNQENVFADNAHGAMGGYEILPSTISSDMMVYDHIGRHLLGGYDGVAASLPSQMDVGDSHSYDFEWSLPVEYNKDNIWVAAMMIDTASGEVINAGKSIYLSGMEDVKPFFVTKPKVTSHKDLSYSYSIRYHDTDREFCNIEIVEPIPSWLSFRKGRSGFAILDGIPENVGNYDITLRLTDSHHTVDQSFQIEVTDSVPPLVSSLTNDFLILPNPNNGFFTLEYDKGVSYILFDRLGRVVSDGVLSRNSSDLRYSEPIDVAGIKDGIYFLKVFDNDDFVKIRKLVVSRY